MKRTLTLLLCIALAGTAMAKSATSVIVADSNNFNDKFCTADHATAQIFVLPSALFSSSKTVKCQDGIFTLRVSEPQADKGHNIYNIDPPKGVMKALDCDGKADIGMKHIAINCYPVSKESASHPQT